MKAITTLAQWFKENPKIASEWDYEANTHLDPEVDGYTVNQKAFWICEKGHHYDSYVYNRTLYGRGCPYCAGKRVLAGYNDLATTRPDLLSKWNYEKNTRITPQEVTESSHIEVWWTCEKGHPWEARVQAVASRTSTSGCPYCSGRYVIKGVNDLATVRPDIAAHWCYEKNNLKPDEVKAASDRIVWWECGLGHRWEAKVAHQAKKKAISCPYCKNFKVLPGFNDLATLCPDVAAEWNYERNGDLKPSDVIKGYREKVWWKCSEGHEWETTVYIRTRKNCVGCPTCYKNKRVNRDL